MNVFEDNLLCRLYDPKSGSDLLLDGCNASVLVTDVHASVTISQRFTNSSHRSSAESCIYAFGLMADAAVCGFSMVRADGTKVEGVVKEKEKARQEYAEALKQGKTASLGSQETPDVFSIAVGNILPSETVTITLRYIQTLTDDEKKDQIKFIFPRTYAQRYGAAPTTNSARGATAHQPFQMDVVVQQAGAIRSISCPSAHPISLELGLPDGVAAPDETSHFATVSLTDRTGYLTQDVVLVITAAGLDAPRCFVEPHPSPNQETTALALTFVPRFNLPDVPGGMEYIFLVDRSGSMEGQNIQLVREALVVLLRGLPTVRTTFNIVSFGSQATKLWETSRAYSQTTLEEATRHVDSMTANYGGTEIATVLELVFSSLSKPLTRPAAVFLLTDGSAWDVSSCVSHTNAAVASLPDPNDPATSLRVFTLGIGDGASSDTCDSIARAGSGIAVYVKAGEAVTGKCARLVRAARTPEVRAEVVWDVPDGDEDGFEMVEDLSSPLALKKKPIDKLINLFAEDATTAYEPSTGPPPKPNPTLPPPARIQQAPLKLSPMVPGSRTLVYAIVQTPSSTTNTWLSNLKGIKIRGRVTSTDNIVELVAPLSKVLPSPFAKSDRPFLTLQSTFLHTLAAKALIRDRTEGKHCFPSSVSALFEPVAGDDKAELKAAYLEKDIVRLGTEFGLASQYTSFIAVDERPSQKQVAPILSHEPGRAPKVASGSGMLMSRTTGLARSRFRSLASHAPNLFGASPLASLRTKGRAAPAPVSPPASARRSIAPGASPWLASTAYNASEYDASELAFIPLSESSARSLSSGHLQSILPIPIPSSPGSSTPLSSAGLLVAIARLQQWHGGFQLTSAFLGLLGNAPDFSSKLSGLDVNGFAALMRKHGVENQDVGATLLALIWMERQGGEDALDMKEKAEEWVKNEVGGEDRARELKESAGKVFA
ncbi:hypothetical protein D9757_003124 [Collybiopsis confluens]|uniref:Uncharacterized protein n=1 Tax=Collybiopsis confluens TaxID=2823264 RepID=A0A8H5HXJ0_9AGAR|nr:hypothetical protein D9757_003124 [Collybiopsis confluens]